VNTGVDLQGNFFTLPTFMHPLVGAAWGENSGLCFRTSFILAELLWLCRSWKASSTFRRLLCTQVDVIPSVGGVFLEASSCSKFPGWTWAGGEGLRAARAAVFDLTFVPLVFPSFS